MRIPSNQYQAVMQHALQELKDSYPTEEIKAMMYWLFEEYLQVNKTQYLLNPQKGMSESELLKFNFAIKDLKKNKPIQYILGYTYFASLKILVNEHTLIPRPETEELVQIVYKGEQHHNQHLKVLDMCTGTGCIPIALQKKMPQHEYFGADFKTEILDLANTNAQRSNSAINFFKFDLLHDHDSPHRFDIIISNPPYVLESDKTQMHRNILDFEPQTALFVDDNNALIFYNKILEFAKRSLKNSGRIYFEIHENKSEEMKELLQDFKYKMIETIQDFRGKIRFIKAQK